MKQGKNKIQKKQVILAAALTGIMTGATLLPEISFAGDHHGGKKMEKKADAKCADGSCADHGKKKKKADAKCADGSCADHGKKKKKADAKCADGSCADHGKKK